MELNKIICGDCLEVMKDIPDEVEISDGYHTFTELYDHRITLFIALCKALKDKEYIWRSQLHSDGSNIDGWFVLGIRDLPGKQMTYHLPNERWDETNFVEERKKAPEFDGHTSQDVLERLKNLYPPTQL
jgi:hypothetical protein